MCENTNQKEWIERFRAVAKAQRRYLWILLISGIFYLALDTTISKQPNQSQQNIPMIGIEVDSTVVWASGSLVLSLIVLAALGTFPALSHAYSKVNTDGYECPFESLDTEPTAIDFIVYAKPGTSLWARLSLVTYPLFITMIVIESIWLWFRLAKSKPSYWWRYMFLVLGGAMIIICFFRLFSLWKSKIGKIIKDKE